MEERRSGGAKRTRGIVGYLIRMKSMQTKLVGTALFLAVLFVGLIMAICIFTFSSYAKEEANASNRSSLAIATSTLEDYGQNLLSQAMVLAQWEGRQDILQDGDFSQLDIAIDAIDHAFKADAFLLIDTHGQVRHSTLPAVAAGDSLANFHPSQQALSGNNFRGFAELEGANLVLIGTTPVHGDNGEIIGAIGAVYQVENNRIVDELRSSIGCHFTIFYDNMRLTSTVIDAAGNRVLGTLMEDRVWERVRNQESYSGVADAAGTNMFVTYASILDHKGAPIASLFSGYSSENYSRGLRQFVLISVVGALIMLTAYILLLGRLFSVVLERPLQKLRDVSERIAKGELDVDIDIENGDGVGEVAEAFKKLRDATAVQASLLEQVAQGNYDIQPIIRGEKDIMGMSLKKMVETSCQAFQAMRSSFASLMQQTQILSSFSIQVAQGNSEQASSVAGVVTMSQDLKQLAADSAKSATSAGCYGADLLQTATSQSEQMVEMVSAAREIDTSAQNIERIIQAIDNIASQTNLLALNASVEAARAGHEGKGFAVVATEVKTLASRSSAAAAETRSLIQTTIQKAADGVGIAEQAKERLDQMQGDIHHSVQLIDEIVSSANSQDSNIQTITENIQQVSEVVNRNSSMAEETAAACKIMVQLAREMEEIISQFRLPGGDGAPVQQSPAPSSLLQYEELPDDKF